MANVTLRSNALYCGPGTNYAGAATGVYGKSAEVLWKEGAYYCVRLSNPKVKGYISNRYVTIPSGTSVSTFTPPDDEIRYVNTSSSAYLGQGTTYETISQLYSLTKKHTERARKVQGVAKRRVPLSAHKKGADIWNMEKLPPPASVACPGRAGRGVCWRRLWFPA